MRHYSSAGAESSTHLSCAMPSPSGASDDACLPISYFPHKWISLRETFSDEARVYKF
jgi:hypothetical protein